MHGCSLCHFRMVFHKPPVSLFLRSPHGTSNLAQLQRGMIRKRNLEVRKKKYSSTLLCSLKCLSFTLASCNFAHGTTASGENNCSLGLGFVHFVSRSNMCTHLVKVRPHGGFDVLEGCYQIRLEGGKSRNSASR